MKRVKSIVGTLTVILLATACALFVLPRLFGVQLYSVVSGSMEPAYRLNDLIYTVPTECENIREGDVVSFAIPGANAVVTHRVVENQVEQRRIFTKGDANDAADSAPVPYENIKGVVRFSIPGIGAALMAVSSGLGRIITVTVGASVILISMILSIAAKDGQTEPKKSGRRAAGGTVETPSYQQLPVRPGGASCGAVRSETAGTVSLHAEGQRTYTKNTLPPGWR